ncbi:outer kinetochore KNL1 complex subunit KNL1 [Fundulus diaphanus]
MESSPSTADQNADGPPSQASRRRSLANLTSRVKRLSQLIKAAPATDDCTAALPHPDSDLDKSPERKTPSAVEPELEMSLGNNTNDGEAQNPTEAEHPSVATSSKTKRLMSRLTMGGFKPKLPKRNDADESTKASFEGDPAKTPAVDVTQQLSRFDQIGNIQDEELVDFEDLSESVDVTIEKECPSSEFDVSEPLEDGGVVEDVTIGRSQRQKRPAVDNDWEERKRLKTDTEFFGTALQPDVDGESSVATDGSSHRSETASRCHTASESTCKNSLFESQLEDCVSDGLKKLEDGTITVLEFFNLFSIDFVINNPRQSVVSGRLLANEDVTPLDLLKDKYISRPKQQVYETDAKTLTGKIEGLKHRKQDLNKPLKTLNRPLWEEVKNFTEEELKSFGAKLKEQNNFFRKQSRVQTHEMKEVLYSSLVLANLEEKQKVLEKMNQADEMIQTLDSCIAEVEAELNAIEEKGSEDKPGLKSLQEEMSKVTEALADRERQICELDLEKKKNSSDAVRLSAEARDLQSHLDTLYMLTEWRLEEQDDSSVFSFLNGTFFLLLEYEKTSGNDAGSKPEKKLTNIGFEFNLNEEMSQCYARLVHKLLSQHIQGESGWLEKYPTSGDVPQLLHDVSLVVSRCRLLGEEVRLLKTWGSLRFDILDMSCSGSHVHVVFSSLKAFSKFEVVFAAQLINKLCVFHVQSFKNVIGNTTIQQIEDIVASLSPGRDLFTRIIKKLHATLLS